MPNFKHFSPLQCLNKGLYDTKVFEGERKINIFGGRRYHRFVACEEAFRDNLLALHWTLRRIAEHYHLTYQKEERQFSGKPKSIKNTILLAMDLESFFLKMKILLDCVAYFIPFYYKDPLIYRTRQGKQDVRDLKDPWVFRNLMNFILGSSKDRKLSKIFKENKDWIEDVLWKRDILQHKFHRISICHDHWTAGCYAFLYEFNKKRDFIPDILAYVSVVYYQLVRFLKDIELHLKEKCEKELPGYKYFHEGYSFSSRTDKAHLFFAAYGRIINDKILIRIHPNRRKSVEEELTQIMTRLKIKCSKCNKVNFKIRSTVENYVLISAHCVCGKVLPINSAVAKRFIPYYLDRNNDSDLWDLRPEYKLEEKVTY